MKFLKTFGVFAFFGALGLIVKIVFNYDFQVSGVNILVLFASVGTCAYLGLIPNLIVKKTVKNKKK